MPELIGEWQTARFLNPGPVQWLGQQLSLEHESNGRAGPTSRSVNVVYFRPGVIIGDVNGWNLVLSPKIFVYVGDLSNNPDISKYRGYGEFRAAFGKNERFGLSFIGRLGEHLREQGHDPVTVAAALTQSRLRLRGATWRQAPPG